MSKGLYRLIQCALPAILSLISVTPASAGQQGQLVNPRDVPVDWSLPDNVIDSQILPRFSLERDHSVDRPLPVYQLADNTYFLYGNIATLNEANRGWNGNAGFIVTGEGVIVIDALGTPRLGKRLIATVRQVTDQPVKYLIITHNHPDHAYGAAAFQDLDQVTIIAHPGTREYNNSSTLEESVAYRRQLLEADMQDFVPPHPDQVVDTPRFDKQVIELGGQSVEIYNTGQHHSFGDLVVYQPDKQILWISDLAFNQRTTYMGDGDSEQILEAQQWLLNNFKDVELMVPGHGGPQTRPFPMVEKTRNYVRRLRREMRQAVEQGVPLLDAVQNSSFEDWEKTRLYQENHRANANHIYREMEKAFFE